MKMKRTRSHNTYWSMQKVLYLQAKTRKHVTKRKINYYYYIIIIPNLCKYSCATLPGTMDSKYNL